MTRFILDTSVAASWAFPDEYSKVATTAFEALHGDATALTPALWWFELRNTLLVGERRARLTSKAARIFLEALTAYDIRIQSIPSEDEHILDLARRHRLTFYDAAYLALAIGEGAPLATLDKALASAAQREGVEILAT